MINEFINIPEGFPVPTDCKPWELVANLAQSLEAIIPTLGEEYDVTDGVAIHNTAVLGHDITIKAPAIIGPECFVGTHSYLRGGVLMMRGAKIGISCEVKTTVMMENAAVAHFNFIGDSILGTNVNFEAGSITANHYNERQDKHITVTYKGEKIATGMKKFGSLAGDNCKVGANAVLSPGTLLTPGTIVGRLQMVEQNPLEK